MAKRIEAHLIAVDQGEEVMFSDFEDDGEMWSGQGTRERRKSIRFSEPFADLPSVHCGLSMWDMDHGHNLRADLVTEDVTCEGFTVLFRTWDDSRIARVRVAWLAIGSAVADDQWQLY